MILFQPGDILGRRKFLWGALNTTVAFGLPSLAPASVLFPRPQKLNPLTMQLDWQLNAQFAGLCVAQAQGLYQQQGLKLKVDIKPAQAEMDVLAEVAKQSNTLGCAEQSLLLDAQAQGVPVVAIATMLQASPLSLMSLADTPIKTLADLKGKTIGVHSDGYKALELVLGINRVATESIILKEIPYADKADRLRSGEFDAVQCYALDEPIEFSQKFEQQPTLLKFSDYGFDAYSQVIFAPVALLNRSPQIVQAFLTATFSGWVEALSHIPETAELLSTDYVKSDSPYANIAYQSESLKNLIAYVKPGSVMGQISPQRWQNAAKQLFEYGLIRSVPPVETSLWDQGWLL